jgi:hypothetical protein
VRSIVRSVLGAWIALAPCSAAAEGFFDVFVGGSWTETTDVVIDSNVAAAGPGVSVGADLSARLNDVRTHSGFTGGLRGGYYFESVPVVDVGIGLDVTFLPLPVPSQTVQATANGTIVIDVEGDSDTITIPASGPVQMPDLYLGTVTFGLPIFVRYPMFTSETRPRGWLQPYLQVGPALVLTNESQAVIPGPLVGGGLTVLPLRWLGLFVEYRYTAFPGVFKLGDIEANGQTVGSAKTEADLFTHRVLAGVSFRF